MMQATPIHVFQQWKDSQTVLDQALQHYLESTVALRSSLCSATHPIESLSVRTTLADTWSNNSPMPDKDSMLLQAQVHLNHIRNMSLTVNNLPLEILLKIFQFATFRPLDLRWNTSIPHPPQQDAYKDLLVLTHVCSHWRRVLVDSPSLWSRFELDSRRPIPAEVERAELYLARSRVATQSLFMEERNSHYFNGDFDSLLKIVESRADNLARLVMLNIPAIHYASRAVSHWLKHGKPETLHTLTIQMEGDVQVQESIAIEDLESSLQASSMLASVRSLSLRGLKFDWYSPVYHNLVQLHVGNIPYEASPHIHHVLGFLGASPRLRKLKMSDMAILRCDQLPLEPVRLPELECMELMSLTYESLDVLLPMIHPESADLSLRITLLALEDNLVSAIHSFLQRANVTRLFLRQDLLARCLPVVPSLRALVIDLDEQPGDECLAKFSYVHESTGARILRCPGLDTLHLYSGSIPIDAIQGVIETHPLIQKLRFSSCYIDPFEDELAYWLKPYVKDVQFNLRLEDSTILDWNHLMV